MLAGMAEVHDPRLDLVTWTADSDQWPGRAGWNAQLTKIFTKTTVFGSGPAASRPSTLIGGRIYWATDTQRMYYDSGAQWTEISPIGDGTVGRPSYGTGNGQWSGPSVPGTAGASRVGARVDHTHPQPAWPVDYAAWTRAANADGAETIASGSRPLIGGSYAAKAGWHHVGWSLQMSTSLNAVDAFAQCAVALVDGATTIDGNIRTDLDRAARPYSYDTWILVDDPRTITFQLRINSAAGVRLLNGPTCRMWAAYMGPAA